MAIYKEEIPNDMPFANKKLCEFIIDETFGNVNAFSKKIGVSQQLLDLLIKPNKNTGKYRGIFPSVKKAVAEYYNIDENWVYQNNEEVSPVSTQHKTNEPVINDNNIVDKLLDEIHRLVEVNDRNSQSIEKLVNLIVKEGK